MKTKTKKKTLRKKTPTEPRDCSAFVKWLLEREDRRRREMLRWPQEKWIRHMIELETGRECRLSDKTLLKRYGWDWWRPWPSEDGVKTAVNQV